MKIYEIMDGSCNVSVGCLLYYEKEKSYIIELQDYLDEWTAPLMFALLVKKGVYTINRELSRLWVKERVIPSDRQNIAQILVRAKMKEYDEMRLMELSKAKSGQDSMYIRELDEIPHFVEDRMEHNLAECVMCSDRSLLCFFNDQTVRKVYLTELEDWPDVRKIMQNDILFNSGHIAADGYCVTFNDSIDLDAERLYRSGIEIPLSLDDFTCFAQKNIIDSSECCSMLDCSRQNLAYLISKDVLRPMKKDVKGNLFLKGEVIRCR